MKTSRGAGAGMGEREVGVQRGRPSRQGTVGRNFRRKQEQARHLYLRVTKSRAWFPVVPV